jgi:hypothetical protein
MDAIAKPQSEISNRQSLKARWRERHFELLQLYDELEIALSSALRSDAAATVNTPSEERTFGKKLNLAFKGAPSLKTHSELIPLRNLLAHAKAEIVNWDGDLAILLRVADPTSAMNARLIPKSEYASVFATWRNMIKSALADAGKLHSKTNSPAK